MSARKPRVSAATGALGAMPLEPSRKARLDADADPLVLAAEMFRPRSTDSFERWARNRLGSWLNPAQVMINESLIRNRYTAVPSCHSAGKALSHGTPVQTPDGPIPVEQCSVGSFVLGSNGRATTVTGVYPQGVRDTYRVTFSDGVSVDCSGDHLWEVTEFAQLAGRIRTRVRIATVTELLADGLYYRPRRDRASRPRYAVPLTLPVAYEKKELPIDPYVMGVWIGDGTIGVRNSCEARGRREGTIAISSWDEFIPEEVARRLPSHLCLHRSKSGHSYQVRNRTKNYGRNSFRDVLIAYGLNVKSPERFIPSDYLYGSIRQRSELLQGLFDTDGSTGKGASERASYSTNSLRLAQDVQQLVRSLGGTARLRGPSRKSKTYSVLIRSIPGCPFKLPRKAERWRIGSGHARFERFRSRLITNITPIGRLAQTCISVDAEDGLFLTDGYVVTHNSYFSALKVGHFIDSHTLGSAFAVTTAPTSAQIESVLWRELHRVHAKADLRGRLTRSGYPQWRIGDELIAYGRRPTEIAPLVHGSPIQTPNGPIPIEQLRIGDEVFGVDGRPTKVIATISHGVQDAYEVTFSDGVKVRCGGNHEWEIAVREFDRERSSSGGGAKYYRPGTPKVLTTVEIARMDPGVKPHLKIAIPLCEPVKYPRRNFVIDPYVLGILIGDGCLTNEDHPSFTNIDAELIDELRLRLPSDLKLIKRGNSNQWSIHALGRGKRNRYASEIRRLGLKLTSRSKFIPSEYLRGSVRQRVELLRGLMDTDGTPPRRGDRSKATFYTTSLRLARDVQELVHSLGGTARLDGPYERKSYIHPKTKERIKHYSAQYQVELRTPGNPFLLERKAEKWFFEKNWASYRKIESIRPCGYALPMSCITVAGDRHLILTDGYAATRNSFQGIHARFVLIVLDEADGIPESLWIAADTLASSGHVRVLAIGNPDSADSHFAKVCRPGSGWNVVRIDGLRTPNFTRNGLTAFPELKQYMLDNNIPFADKAIEHVPPNVRAEWKDVLLSPEWVYERMQRWGVVRREEDQSDGSTKVTWTEPALWLSKVRGRSPTEGSEGIIPLAWVELAIQRWLEWDANGRPPIEGRFIFGADIADSGKDETVVSRRRGYCIVEFTRTPLQDTDTTAKRLARRLRSNPGSTSCVDGMGIGAGVVNQIRGMHLPVIAFIGAAKAEGLFDITGEFKFANVRTAAYWKLRELLDPVNSSVKVMLPPDEDMKTDLTVPTWSVKTGAVIAMEPKESVTKRLRRSPDVGDCTAITFWPNVGGSQKINLHQYGQIGIGDSEWAAEPEPETLDDMFIPSARHRRERLASTRVQQEQVRRDQRRRHVFTYSGSNWDEEFIGV